MKNLLSKKLLTMLISATMLVTSAVNVFAEDFSLTMQIDNPIMVVNGTETEIDEGRGTTPVIVNDRTLVPIRAIIEAMGGTVDWDGDTQTVTLGYGDNEIVLVIDSTTAYLNGEASELDTAPAVINDRTMLPIRYIAEGFSFDVDWDNDTQTVTIIKTDDEAAETTEPTEEPAVTAEPTEETMSTAEPTEEPSIDGEDERIESKTLVAYFSNTGNTEGIAEYIAEITGGDLFEIVPEEPYTDDDLDYNDSSSRSTIEMNDPDARPAIASEVENMEQYDTIFIGYPIWWGDAPRIISTFLESYDFSDKTIIPFCTSASSGIGSSASDLHSLASDADWEDGRRFSGSATLSSVEDWIDTLELDD